jgi:hypothetical protein
MPDDLLTFTPVADDPADCVEWFSDRTVRQEVIEYELCEDVYVTAEPFVDSATGCVRFKAWDNCAGGEGSAGDWRVGDPYVDDDTGCVKAAIPWPDECRCEPVCWCEPVVFRFWTDPNEPCFFRMYIDETISPGQTVSGNIAWGDYSWDYTITCERTGEGVGPCVRSWPTGCDGFCDKCQYVFTLEATAHGPGCDGQHRECVSLLVHVERPTNCDQPECECTECKILYPDGEDQVGEYRAFLCPFFTVVQIYLESSMQ